MSKHVTVEYFDNLDGSPDAIPIVFSNNGSYYEMALSAEHARQFHAAIKPWVTVAKAIDPPRNYASPNDLNGY